jgi:DNA processing protein
MDENRVAFYALSLVPNLGPKRCLAIIQAFDDLTEIYEWPVARLIRSGYLPRNVAQHWDPPEFLDLARQRMQQLSNQGHHLILYQDEEYPSRLKHIPSPPLCLYAGGDPSILDVERSIGIVGTRKPTRYGADQVRSLISGLSNAGVHVISGMAFGIDAIAHRAALENGLLTTAVLGGAIDRLYPAEHNALARKVVDNGCLLSEHFLGTEAEREFFPMRNRIIAGLSDIVVVGESKERGGSMITAWMANDFQREVAAFPGDITRPTSRGCNLLIKSNQAHLIEDAEDVIKLMRWDESSRKPGQLDLFEDLDDHERQLMDLLREEKDLHVDQLSIRMKLPVSRISHLTFQLEMKGLITSLSGNRVAMAMN